MPILRNPQGSVIGTAGRQIIPISTPTGRVGYNPRGRLVRASREPAVTDKAQTQAKHVYHVFIADKDIMARLSRANSRPLDDPDILYRVRIMPDNAMREFETELFFILPLNGLNRTAHNSGAQVRGFVNLANISREEYRDLVFGGVVTTQARRIQDGPSGYGGTGNQWVGMSFGVADIIHRGPTFINAGDQLMYSAPAVRPSRNVPGSVESLMAVAGQPIETIVPTIVSIQRGSHGYETYSMTTLALVNGDLAEEDIGVEGHVRSLKTSLDFIMEVVNGEVVVNADVMQRLRETCYAGDPLRLRLEQTCILHKMDREVEENGHVSPGLWTQWVIFHTTELQETRWDDMRRRKIGRALNSANSGGKLTFEVDV